MNDPASFEIRRRIIREKESLRAIYEEWYRALAAAMPDGPGRVLEVGSGSGCFADVQADAIRSDIVPCPWLDLALDGLALPFDSGTLRGIAMTNVLHHLPHPSRFFSEAARCVRPGGVVAMIEPWHTPWSNLVYRYLHHEPFLPDAASWESIPDGPMGGANGALPWILFVRDRARFQREHPEWSLRRIEPHMPFRYLLAGGVSLRELIPARLVAGCGRIERALGSLSARLAMFAAIVLERRGDASPASDQSELPGVGERGSEPLSGGERR